MMVGRVPPHDLGAERGLLGSVILAPKIFGQIDGVVVADDFYLESHATTWRAMRALAVRHEPIDLITVPAELERAGKLELVGGHEFILSLTETLATWSNAEAYAITIARLSSRRRIGAALLESFGRAYDLEIGHDAFLDGASVAIAKAFGSATTGRELRHISGAVQEVIAKVDLVARSGGTAGVTGLRSGLEDLDLLTTGMHPGEVIVVAGRPGMGKSGFATNLLLAGGEQARESGGCVVMFGLEMPRADLALRLLAADANLNVKSIRSARLSKDGMSDLTRSCAKVADLPIFECDEAGLTIGTIRSLALRQHAKTPVRLVIIDYLQLMEAMERGVSRENAIADASRGLKRLAKELGCPVVALAQLNRECEKRPDKRPVKSDLRESGSIEQDADTILLLYRRGYYAALAAKETKPAKRNKWDPEPEILPGEDDGVTEIIVDKNRHGECRSVKVMFRAESIYFASLERDYPSHPYGDDHA